MTKLLDELFIFCPFCKNKLSKKDNRLVECSRCGFHYYWNAAPTVGALLENSKGEFLLVERKLEPKKGYWDLAGGFIEVNETFEDGLRRELKEELNVEVGGVTYIGSSTDIYPYKGVTYNTIVAVFHAKVEGKVYPSDDVASYKYFSRNNFPKKDFAFPGLLDLILWHLTSADNK